MIRLLCFFTILTVLWGIFITLHIGIGAIIKQELYWRSREPFTGMEAIVFGCMFTGMGIWITIKCWSILKFAAQELLRCEEPESQDENTGSHADSTEVVVKRQGQAHYSSRWSKYVL